MKTLLKGEVHFVENYKIWIIDVSVKWTKRRTTITLNSKKTDLKSKFLSCSISKADILSYISRSDTINFRGKKSIFSELLLENIETQYLMNSKNPAIKLDDRSLIFKGGIKKKDFNSLSNIFKLFEILMDEIDSLNDSSVSQQLE